MSIENLFHNAVEKREVPRKLKIAIIEDQYFPQILILNAVYENFQEMVDRSENSQDVILVTNYQDAEKLLQQPIAFDIVFLDNNLVAKPIDRTNQKKNSCDDDIKKFDPKAYDLYDEPENFSELPMRDGYALIKEFQKKGALVIGTSSMRAEELQRKGLPLPEFQVTKTTVADFLNSNRDEILKKLDENKDV